MTARDGIWQADPWPDERWPDGWTVRYVAETGSTNADLLAALGRGATGDRSVLAAGHQSAGRGRLDRRWDAPPGANLLVSLAFTDVPTPPVELTHRVGLAALDVARRWRPDATVMLKWPNDVLLDDQKLAGILAQREPTSGAVVVGLGLNVGWAPEGAARVGDGETDAARTPSAFLRALLLAYDDLGSHVAERYRRALATLGREVTVELPGGETLAARAVDVDGDGRLVVEPATGPPGRTVHLDVGDVVHARHRP